MTDQPDPSQSRRSALTVAVVFLAIAGWQLHRAHQIAAIVSGSLGGILLLIAVALPRAAAQFHRYWMALAGVLGYVNSRVLLTIIYFMMFAPLGWLARLSGKDPLQRRSGPSRSYWIKRARTRQTVQGFERSF